MPSARCFKVLVTTTKWFSVTYVTSVGIWTTSSPPSQPLQPGYGNVSIYPSCPSCLYIPTLICNVGWYMDYLFPTLTTIAAGIWKCFYIPLYCRFCRWVEFSWYSFDCKPVVKWSSSCSKKRSKWLLSKMDSTITTVLTCKVHRIMQWVIICWYDYSILIWLLP